MWSDRELGKRSGVRSSLRVGPRVGLGLVALLAWGTACGGRSHAVRAEGAVGSAGTGAGGSAGSGRGGAGGRAPMQHRPQPDPACTLERGSNEPQAVCDRPVSCERDADCTDGEQGRCLQTRFPCNPVCSYDECSTDADCAEREPCECRSSGADSAPNHCLVASNCRVDADCGPGGYCSPSLVDAFCTCTSVDYCALIDSPCSPPDSCSCGDSCGHGYFCHAPDDECLDDADCPGGSACSFDLAHQRFICAACWPVP